MAYSPVSWRKSSSGNPVVQHSDGQVICTVFKNAYGAWRVVVNLDSAYGSAQPHFSDQYFSTAGEAKSHAEQLLAIRHTLKPTPKGQSVGSFSAWREQSKKVNGAPTYGRRTGRKQASVKKAASGQWYYVMSVGPATSEPVGWFDTEQAAMAACDAKHLPS